MPIRVTPEQIEALRRIDTPTVCNAVEKLGVRPATDGYTGAEIRCLLPHLGVMLGFAVTACFGTTDPERVHSMEPYWRMYEALDASPKPAVIVAQEIGPDPARGCVFGDGMATVAARMGAVGLLTNSGVRDLAGLRVAGLQVFGLGAVAAHGNFGVVAADVPVEIGNVRIEPGDLVHGDENGVIVFPAQIVPDVIRVAQEIESFESSAFGLFRSPDFSLAKLKAWYAEQAQNNGQK